MHNCYSDIYALADAAGGQEPQWWDENGVPRFAPFDRSLRPNIYADWIALVRIGCAACGQEFLVEMSGDAAFGPPPEPETLHYGDPPWHHDQYGHPCAGNTMTCDDLGVVEFWTWMETAKTGGAQSSERKRDR